MAHIGTVILAGAADPRPALVERRLEPVVSVLRQVVSPAGTIRVTVAGADRKPTAAARFGVGGWGIYSWRIKWAYSRSRGPDDNRGFQRGLHMLIVWN